MEAGGGGDAPMPPRRGGRPGSGGGGCWSWRGRCKGGDGAAVWCYSGCCGLGFTLRCLAGRPAVFDEQRLLDPGAEGLKQLEGERGEGGWIA